LLSSSNLQTASRIDGGDGNDSVYFGAELSGGSVMGAAGEDTLNFSAAVNNNATIQGDAGSDVLLLSGTLATAGVYGGDGGDSMVFFGNVTNALIDGGANNDTLSFGASFVNSTVASGADDDTLTFTGAVSNSAISLGSGNVGVTFSTLAGGGTSLIGGNVAGASQTINFSAAADLVEFDNAFGPGSIFGGSGNDTLTFLSGSSINASSVVKLEAGDDSLVFNSGMVVSGQFGAGAGNDFVGGAITIGNSDVSFWGGSGNDQFSFSSITGSPVGGTGTAYFWNEAGADTISFGSAVSGGVAGSAGVAFGVTLGSSFEISFAGAQTSTAWTGGAISNVFSAASNNEVSANFSGDTVTLRYGDVNGDYFTAFGGSDAMSVVFIGAAVTEAVSSALPSGLSTGTGSFGTLGSIPTFS
jgi:hypothetical protein